MRPAVISEESAQALDEFRRFRHLVRNVYTRPVTITQGMNRLVASCAV